MEKQKVVAFNEYGARIFTNPDEATLKLIADHYEASVVNPDLSAVDQLPPDQWKLVDGQVVSGENKEVPESVNHAIKEVIVIQEKIVEVEKIIEVVKEKIVEVEKIVEKEVEVFKDRIVEVEKEVEKVVNKEIEVVREVERQIAVVPNWIKVLLAVETLIIVIKLVSLI